MSGVSAERQDEGNCHGYGSIWREMLIDNLKKKEKSSRVERLDRRGIILKT